MQGQLTTIWQSLRCGVDDWMGIWGDPWLSGSIFVCSYLITASLIFLAAQKKSGRERIYWRICGCLFIFQVLNTPLDLHALIWTSGRCLAHAQGWYENRQEIQYLFLAVMAILVSLFLALVVRIFCRSIFSNLLLTLGVLIAIGFTLIRGVSLHDAAHYYGHSIGPFRAADFIEFAGILLALCAAVVSLRQTRNPPNHLPVE